MSENKMGTMPVGKLIVNMSWPAILSMLLQALYNVVDSFFVSKISEAALTAITYIFPVQMVMISVAVGTGVGINSLISRRLGAGRQEEADLAASHGYRLSFFSWSIFLVFGIFLSGPLMNLMTDTEYIIEEGTIYLSIVTIGSVFLFVQISTEKILQATGNMVMPMICSVIGAVTNIVLDPVLIFGLGPFPQMGITGAAVATITGQFLSMVLGQYILFARDHKVRVRLRGWKWQPAIARDIYAVGFPSILMQCIASVLQFGMNMILNTFTETAVAVMGVYGRLQSFVFMPVFGLNQGVLPIMGFNYGARDKKRLMETYKKGFALAFAIMLAGFIVFQMFPHQLLSIFNDSGNPEMYEIGVPALRLISICFLPASYGIMTSSVFQATGHGFLSLWSSLIRQLVCVLPIAYIFGRVFGLNYVWLGFPLAEIIGTAYLIITFTHLYRKELKHLGEGTK
ncbi:MAG: MATE family efflux transporter [Clostridiales bacterium]|nr:MATE family efflux transporter [Clostridiales bacterium]MDD7034808.1 MATE family efflux transporter [Bacillota bacterium]MDY2920965.1 MATE family efflux transporter [Lentihominibacter sp.]